MNNLPTSKYPKRELLNISCGLNLKFQTWSLVQLVSCRLSNRCQIYKRDWLSKNTFNKDPLNITWGEAAVRNKVRFVGIQMSLYQITVVCEYYYGNKDLMEIICLTPVHHMLLIHFLPHLNQLAVM